MRRDRHVRRDNPHDAADRAVPVSPADWRGRLWPRPRLRLWRWRWPRLQLRYRLRTLLCEDVVPLACTGAAEAPRWFSPEESERLLTDRPERNLLPTALEQQLDFTLPALEKLRAALEPVAQERARAQREAHERVRAATRAKGRVAVEPVLLVDLLGVYVLLPRLV